MSLKRLPTPKDGVRGILMPPDGTADVNTGVHVPEDAEGERIKGDIGVLPKLPKLAWDWLSLDTTTFTEVARQSTDAQATLGEC
jgi:hypothetical protein